MAKWHPTKFPGVRYREHPTRKHGIQRDRYYAIRFTVNGVRHEEGLGWSSEGWSPQEAADELGRLRKAQRTGEGPQTLAEKRQREKERKEAEEQARKERELANMTFSDVWEKYKETAQSSKSQEAWRTERNLYDKHLSPVLGDRPIRQIAPFHLEKLKKSMLDGGLSPRTVEYALAVIRQVFNYARDHDLFHGINPVSKVKAPKKDNRRIRFLTYEEAERLLKALAEKSKDLHDMALLALHCGPRAGEIFALTWNDVDLERNFVTFRHTKNGRVRHVPMTERVRQMFQSRNRQSGSELIFPARGGKQRKDVSKVFTQVVEDLGLNEGVEDSRQRFVFHSLRHTCASWLIMSGVPLYTVKEFLGHQQISQTERYAHLAPDSLQQATNALNGIGKEGQGGKVINLQSTE
ncbi:MAG: site-specific integrase [Desulfohalobiaceae bacterium]|nr:site-specific integrase [Desulfohalobiaceae bacterium]